MIATSQTTQQSVQNALWRAWAAQLLRDYERINAVYLHKQLRTPTLEISPDLAAWGQWCPETRRISIALRHVNDYSWSSVLETLKHEMAHQYVTEVLQLHDVHAHGEAWRRACALLGIEAAARGDGGVPWSETSADGANTDPKLRKIRKLLALADNNTNENEVQAALEQARAYLLRYNLDEQQAGARDGETMAVRWLGEPLTRIEGHRYRIASILDEHFFVHCIWVPTYIAHRNKPAMQLETCGETSHVQIASYVHDTLLRQLRGLWENYRVQRRVKGISARNSYWDGLLTGFATQLGAGRKQNMQQGLVWTGDARLNEFFKRRNPRVSTTRIGGRRDDAIRRDGVAAGRSLQIKKPIENTQSNVRGLLR